MPEVKKQIANPVTKKKTGGSVFDRIVPVHEVSGGIILNVYGRTKTGKTRLASTFPKRSLIIGAEDGTKSVSTVKGIDFLGLQDPDEVFQIADKFKDGTYKTIILDTATKLQDLGMAKILDIPKLPEQGSWGMASQGQWGQCANETKERLRSLVDLGPLGINVVIIAQERNFNDENNSDLLFPSVGSALSPSVAGWLDAACDYICQTFIREQTKTIETKQGDKKISLLQKTGKKEFCLRIGPDAVYKTGFRLPPGQALPDMIVDPSYDKILKLIKGE